MGEEIDKTKNNIKADRINDEEKEQLFKKFVESGGQVLDERKKRRITKIDRKQQKKFIETQEKKKQENKQKKSGEAKTGSKKSSSGKNIYKKNSLMDRLVLWYSSVFNGVRTFSGKRINPTLILDLNGKIKTHISNLETTALNIIRAKEGVGAAVRKELLEKNPELLSILFKMEQLYNDNLFKYLQKKESVSEGSGLRINAIADAIKYLFKKFYVLNTYQNRILEAYTTGLQLQKLMYKRQPDKKMEILDEVKVSIRYLFEDFFPKLFLLYCNVIEENLSIADKRIIKLLDIREEDLVGHIPESEIKLLTEGEKDEEESETEEGEEEKDGDDGETEEGEKKEEKEKEKLTDYQKTGAEIIKGLNYDKHQFTKEDELFYYDTDDKLYTLSIILEKFEKEFSFILTSNKIIFTIDYHEGQKTDLKKSFNDIYMSLNKCYDDLKEYSRVIREFKDKEGDASIPVSQKGSILHSLSISQSKISIECRKRLLETLQQMENLLKKAMDKGEEVIQNINENLAFDNIGGKKMLNNKTPRAAIELCYSFVSYLRYMMEAGKLAGSGLKIYDE